MGTRNGVNIMESTVN